ncbi:MAG: FAD-dependent oxidoreductase, partial [Chthoniobacteraceae bacterium]
MKLLAILVLPVFALAAESPVESEVCVYGGTPAGVMAAIAAARQGHSVALIDINAHTGGMVSGGLVATDMGDRKTVGGLADDFFLRIVRFYREKYGADSPQLAACRDGHTFEPHVAEAVFDAMLAEQPKIQIFHRLRYRSLALDGLRVASLTVEDPKDGTTRTFAAKVFIDASYEGDVMAGAHVPYRVGRESRAEFGEYL